MDRYSAWTTSLIQNKETAIYERNTECRIDLLVSVEVLVRGARWPRIKRCELTKMETAKDRVGYKQRTKTMWQRLL